MLRLTKHTGRCARRPIAGASIFALVVLLLSPRPAGAQYTIPITSPFIEPDSRFVALGSAGVALVDDANATFWNPAGLASLDGFEVATSRIAILPEAVDGVFTYPVSVAMSQGHLGTFAANVRYVPWGKPECREESPACMNEPYDLSIGGSYGRAVAKGLALGTTVSIVRLVRWTQDPEADTGTTFGVDVGAQYRAGTFRVFNTPAVVSVGFALTNVGPRIELQRFDHSLPTCLRLGVALKMRFDSVRSLTILSDAQERLFHDYPNLPGRQGPIGIGAEYQFNRTFAFRGGVTTARDLYDDNAEFTLGLGLNLLTARLDISWVPEFFTQAIVWERALRVSAVVGV
ncbi:MAG: PorV/PorQ family protein [Rhodothermales bacterium]